MGSKELMAAFERADSFWFWSYIYKWFLGAEGQQKSSLGWSLSTTMRATKSGLQKHDDQ